MSSLADRLKDKGFKLIDAKLPVPQHTQLTGAAHKELSLTAREKRQIFTPLEQRGEKAIQAEAKFKRDCEKDLLEGVRKQLLQWAQECVASTEKRQKLQEKSILKCRVQAQWSNDLNKDLHAFIEGFGGRVQAACEKENQGSSRPSWEKYAARDEKWVVGFDANAFEKFIRTYPTVLGPNDAQLREFVGDYCKKVSVEASTLRALFEALEFKFGPLTDSLKKRAKLIAAETVNNLAEEGRRGSKNRDASEAGSAAKRARTSAGLHSQEDAAWAAEALAPFGLRPGSQEPLVRPPDNAVASLLEGLKVLVPTPELLKSTSLGIIVSSYRTHAAPEIARAAKDLVTSWKADVSRARKASALAKTSSHERVPSPHERVSKVATPQSNAT